ncbi:MAG: T9SS type A sorting domain-containing protein [Bacteroidetes bacterium]|nr:T9SS type A sorting domain-containing protein [Bacteroidota bacterium]
MKNALKTKVSIVQKFKILPILGVVAFGVIIAFVLFYLTIPKTSIAGSSHQYPSMSFHDPVVISGIDGQVNAVYKFSDVSTGIDAHIKIISFYNGASVSTMDNFAGGYYDAWQPFINSPGNKTSWINWRITFKKAGTNTDTILTRLAATAIDVDGDGSTLKEIVGAHRVSTYSAMAGAQVVVTFRNDSCIATSSTNNVANIDTNRTQAMFMKIFNNVSTINYRTGAVYGSSGSQIRQNSIYFKYFDMMPSPLPVELISFKATKISNQQVQVSWSTASEKNNDFFTIERSLDGNSFIEVQRVKGAGNSSSTRNYSIIDQEPTAGVNYYRLIQTDFDGTTEIFKPIVVDIGKITPGISKAKVISNPFIRNFSVVFNSEETTQAQVILLSLNGHVVYKESIDLKAGKNEYHFTNGDELKSGAYILKIQTEIKMIVSEKVVKN